MGSQDPKLTIYDAQTGAEQYTLDDLGDACNGVSVSFDSNGSEGHFAVATGQRHYGIGGANGDSDEDSEDDDRDSDNDVGLGGDIKIFSFKY